MTTYQFTPNTVAPFQFQPTLDDSVYTVIVTWNLFGQRWYINLYALDGSLVVCTPNVGSPDDYDINLVGGYFTTSSLVFRQSSQQFVVTP